MASCPRHALAAEGEHERPAQARIRTVRDARSLRSHDRSAGDAGVGRLVRVRSRLQLRLRAAVQHGERRERSRRAVPVGRRRVDRRRLLLAGGRGDRSADGLAVGQRRDEVGDGDRPRDAGPGRLCRLRRPAADHCEHDVHGFVHRNDRVRLHEQPVLAPLRQCTVARTGERRRDRDAGLVPDEHLPGQRLRRRRGAVLDAELVPR